MNRPEILYEFTAGPPFGVYISLHEGYPPYKNLHVLPVPTLCAHVVRNIHARGGELLV